MGDTYLRPMHITRTTLYQGQVTQGGQPSHGHFTTHNQGAFVQPAPSQGSVSSSPRTLIHKNTSALPGFSGPSDDRFTTTSSLSYQPFMEAPVGTPRHQAVFKAKMEKTDVFGRGNADKAKRKDAIISTAHAMGRDSGSARRNPNPKFVHGGSFRNKSNVALDRNLVVDGAPPPDFSTTTNAAQYDVTTQLSARRTHKFQLPQKNVSTYMTTAMTNIAAPAPSPQRTGPGGILSVGRQRGVREFVTVTDHSQVQGPSDRSHALYQHPAAGSAHYKTSNNSHYLEHPELRLVVPPGKGGVDMTKSTIPLGRDVGLPPETSHTQSMYRGHLQVPVRATCASRGTLGCPR